MDLNLFTMEKAEKAAVAVPNRSLLEPNPQLASVVQSVIRRLSAEAPLEAAERDNEENRRNDAAPQLDDVVEVAGLANASPGVTSNLGVGPHGDDLEVVVTGQPSDERHGDDEEEAQTDEDNGTSDSDSVVDEPPASLEVGEVASRPVLPSADEQDDECPGVVDVEDTPSYDNMKPASTAVSRNVSLIVGDQLLASSLSISSDDDAFGSDDSVVDTSASPPSSEGDDVWQTAVVSHDVLHSGTDDTAGVFEADGGVTGNHLPDRTNAEPMRDVIDVLEACRVRSAGISRSVSSRWRASSPESVQAPAHIRMGKRSDSSDPLRSPEVIAPIAYRRDLLVIILLCVAIWQLYHSVQRVHCS
ncbi:Uncharacterized protein PBTT_05981 [Plasmodiophora brassicae]